MWGVRRRRGHLKLSTQVWGTLLYVPRPTFPRARHASDAGIRPRRAPRRARVPARGDRVADLYEAEEDRREERDLFSMASGYGRARGRGVTQ